MNTLNRNTSRPAGLRRQGGFTLVESLVAMVVISVGMLGIAALYVEGLRAGRTSNYRMNAIGLAADMADRIRTNPNAGAAYAGAGAANACEDDGADLTPAQLAAADLFCWQQGVQARLPGGVANVAVVGGAGASNLYTIAVTWNEPGLPAPVNYVLSMQL
jgi:type IV pilus assembly protein PilV